MDCPKEIQRRYVPDYLPLWAKRENEKAWCKWVESRTRSCRLRGGKNGPDAATWRGAIVNALRASRGRGEYSKITLKLKRKEYLRQPWIHPFYPLVDHNSDLSSCDIVVETRLVNDMKSLLSPEEFKKTVGHLSATMGVQAKRFNTQWCPDKHF
jgi:hypothetical protein